LFKGNRDLPTRALLFDSWYDRYKGVAMLMAMKDGSIRIGQNISLASTGKSYEVKEIGILNPFPLPLPSMYVI